MPKRAVRGTKRLWLYSAQLRPVHQIALGRWNLAPCVGQGANYPSMDGFTESDTSALRIRHDGQSDTYVGVQPAVDIQTKIGTHGGTLIRPRLTLGITLFICNAAPAVNGHLVSAPAEIWHFTPSTDLHRTRFDVAAWVDIATRKGLILPAEAFASFSENTQGSSGGLSLDMHF